MQRLRSADLSHGREMHQMPTAKVNAEDRALQAHRRDDEGPEVASSVLPAEVTYFWERGEG